MIRSERLEEEAVLEAARMMAAAARTSPKTRGMDNIEVAVIDDPATRGKLIDMMKALLESESRPSFERDALSTADSRMIMIIGVRSNPAGLNCGFCGYKTCDDFKKTKGICAYNSIDLGLAVGSAISIASNFHIDNRIMFSIGKAALELKLFGKDVKQALGVPLSVTGKSPFFDRK